MSDALGFIVGGCLGIGAAALLALGMVVQRYALIHKEDEDVSFYCCTVYPRCGIKARDWAWIAGLALYGAANGLYSPGLLMAPLSLMGSIFTLLLVFNMVFARIILKEVLTPPKVLGALTILGGVACVAIGTPVDQKNDFTPEDIEALFKRPAGAVYCICLVSFVILTIIAMFINERMYPLTELEASTASGEADAEAAAPEPAAGAAIGEGAARSTTGGAPAWLAMIMAIVYPASLGADEGICQLNMQAAMSQSHQCNTNGADCSLWTVYFCWATWAVASLATAVYMRYVFQRFEVTRALPVEYGTLNVANVLSGLLFFDESAKMEDYQLYLLIAGAVIVVLGLAISSLPSLPGIPNNCCDSSADPEVIVAPADDDLKVKTDLGVTGVGMTELNVVNDDTVEPTPTDPSERSCCY